LGRKEGESPLVRPRRPPMTDLPKLLDEAARAADELRDAEDSVERARERFYVSLRRAHDAGGSYALLGRIVGLTRQRVARILSDR
jgi:hypothetical protein